MYAPILFLAEFLRHLQLISCDFPFLIYTFLDSAKNSLYPTQTIPPIVAIVANHTSILSKITIKITNPENLAILTGYIYHKIS